MSHLRLPPFVVGFGAPGPPGFWFCGGGGGGGAALPGCGWGAALPSERAMLMPAWGGGCGGFAAFAAPSSGEFKMMTSARRRRFDVAGGAPLCGGMGYSPWR